MSINPFLDDKILDSSKGKESAVDNIEFDENGRMFSKQVENAVGKGEIIIARYKQFLLFPQCFQKTWTADTLKTRACLGNGLDQIAQDAYCSITVW